MEYLLGRLTDVAQKKVEERLLTDHEFYEEFLLAEEELIDSYLNNSLDSADRRDFEKYFLAAPERKQQLVAAQILQEHLTRTTSELNPIDHQPSWLERFQQSGFSLKYLIPATALILVAVALGWFYRSRQHAPVTDIAVIQSPSPTASILTIPENAKTKTVILLPEKQTMGGGERPTAESLDSDIQRLKIKLQLSDHKYPAYQVKYDNGVSEPVLYGDRLQPEVENKERFLIVSLPPKSSYRFVVYGVAADGNLTRLETYRFQLKH